MRERVASVVAVAAALAIVLLGVGCGSSGGAGGGVEALQKAGRWRAYRLAVQRRAILAREEQRQARREAARRAARLAALRERRARAAEAGRRAARERREVERAEEREVEAGAGGEESECDPNYSGACLQPNVSDYDCEGGSGNGPYYTGEVTVVGVDHYGLDADGDGVGCEGG